MQQLAIILVLISAAMHALRNLFTKKASDKQAFVWWYEVFGLLFFTPVFLFVFSQQAPGVVIALPYVVLSGFVHFIYWFFLTKALDKGDLSLVYPIMRSSPALVLIFSLTILKEDVSAFGAAGIFLIVIGVYTISMQKLDIDHLSQPFRALFKERAVQFAFLTMVSVAGYSLVDKVAVGLMHPVLFAYIYPWVSMSLFTTYIWQAKEKGVLKKEWAAHKWSILLCGILSIFGYFLILLAFTLERVSYVVGLRQLSIVFAVILGGQILQERNKWNRLISAIVIFSGTYLIAVAG
jgi:uncharacterized membrane protein